MLGAVLALLGWLFGIGILLDIGVVVLVIGLILLLLGGIGHPVGGRRWYY